MPADTAEAPAPAPLLHTSPRAAPPPIYPFLSATAKLSPILLNRTSRLSFAGDPRPRRLSTDRVSSYSGNTMSLEAKEARRRRSSSLVYKEPPESLEQLSDQAALPNLNAEWVNAKGECSRARGHIWRSNLQRMVLTRPRRRMDNPLRADLHRQDSL